ncbi:peptidoglycan-binding domain-containing protein [Micromonospora sp. WMMD975]|uniref:peptidoglycan-binding domain-containing protein n=1 Tax=Micromonospora sp. WMMD975 TaxID=3016087 RepID=UPI00249A5387|nr:peptidoglycan-binding domain-containing protein [Micromonospora sp. WMMD975]WFE34643.1 peptidoglycan-binding domain-containing protein [Micromonospora sp. WMMD975]
MTRRARALALAAVVLAAGVAGQVVVTRWLAAADEPVRAGKHDNAAATVAVERTDLSTARTMPGTLGYGVPRTIRATGGTVTWLPAVGAAVKRGRPLYRNDDRPVTVLYGTTPLFRKLDGPELVGRDVRVLVDNLRALGYRVGDEPSGKSATLTVRPGDAVLTAQVVRAVKAWQKDAGLPATGVLDPVDVVVLPGAARVSRVTAQLGDPATGDVLTVTGTRKVVTVAVRAAELGSIRHGATVDVELPAGDTTRGRVTRIDRDARSSEAGGDEDATAAEVTVTVELGDSAAVRNLDSAPVQVSFAGESRRDVLAVPIAALLALREGGYAVQVAGGPTVAVETGMFAMGMVEISGAGVDEGTRVVTAS